MLLTLRVDKKQARRSKVCQPLYLLSSVSYIDSLLFFFSGWDFVFTDDKRESNPTSFEVYANGG